MKRQLHKSNVSVHGLRVFVVEDESVIAMQLEDMLLDVGCEVVGPAMRFKAAQTLVEEDLDVGVAILDVNLGDRTVFPIAERLRAFEIPIVFATGYGRDGVPSEWTVYPILQKPYTARQIEDAILTIVGAQAD
ncbi:response regulator [Fulvimarina sp. 2208YS6-2-32]|uniref:Response regulator n=1 Tax=Fulvimarina uroteuthidis TaxID=3098149 RepID=A0ABU5I443_9HYPH|nr:response regulator [Fulvimarina sp. 2208YS6-2-32]MDY8109976.1 response regulator [Fulvimarina sp. 2208YS6-2-32]